MKTNLDKFLGYLWKKERPSRLGQQWRGWPASDIIAMVDQQNREVDIPALNLWMRVYDENFRWAVVFTAALWEENNKEEAKPEVLVFYVIFSSIIADMMAIKRLVNAGLDMQAKQILRNYKEYCEIALLLSFRPELTEEFRQTDSAKSSQEFWYKYISKGKLRGYIKREKNKILENAENDFRDFEYEDQEDSILSAAAHPSYIASISSVAPYLGEGNMDKQWHPLEALGHKSNLSIRTLNYATLIFYEMLTIFFFNMFLKNKNDPLFKINPEEKFHNYLITGRRIATKLSIIVVNKMNRSSQKDPADIVHWFQSNYPKGRAE